MEMIHQTEESTNHEHQSELAVKEKLFQTNPKIFQNFKTCTLNTVGTVSLGVDNPK